ncbi:hypothetical protein ABRZ24_00435 [Brenneria populi]|uniref:Uncharacterized protein n=1 Tax=Brenneria populi TaxID=1505588 RepID=A0ABU6JK64_9GAMM|nr:hypothetical protein [Brenneria populi Li et al. 2015]
MKFLAKITRGLNIASYTNPCLLTFSLNDRDVPKFSRRYFMMAKTGRRHSADGVIYAMGNLAERVAKRRSKPNAAWGVP